MLGGGCRGRAACRASGRSRRSQSGPPQRGYRGGGSPRRPVCLRAARPRGTALRHGPGPAVAATGRLPPRCNAPPASAMSAGGCRRFSSVSKRAVARRSREVPDRTAGTPAANGAEITAGMAGLVSFRERPPSWDGFSGYRRTYASKSASGRWCGGSVVVPAPLRCTFLQRAGRAFHAFHDVPAAHREIAGECGAGTAYRGRPGDPAPRVVRSPGGRSWGVRWPGDGGLGCRKAPRLPICPSARGSGTGAAQAAGPRWPVALPACRPPQDLSRPES